MSTTQFLFFIFLYVNLFIRSVTLTDLAAKEIRLLDAIDNSQVLPSLVINVDEAFNNYIRGQIAVERNAMRAVVWKKLPSSDDLEQHFRTHFKIIKFDRTYQDLIKKDFDYTSQGTFQVGETWERIVFTPLLDGYLTLFLSYTIKQRSCWFWFWCSAEIPQNTMLDIESFVNRVSVRMFDKLLNPTKSIYRHGMLLISNKSMVQFLLVYHDGRNGYVEKPVSSFDDGLREQQQIDKKKLSSCILMIKAGQKSVYSIRHPIIQGYTIPDFHAYYKINRENSHSTPHMEL